MYFVLKRIDHRARFLLERKRRGRVDSANFRIDSFRAGRAKKFANVEVN